MRSLHFSKHACKKSHQNTKYNLLFGGDTSSRKRCFLLPGEKKHIRLFRGGATVDPRPPPGQRSRWPCPARAMPMPPRARGLGVAHMGALRQGRASGGAAGPAATTAGGCRR